MTKEVAHGRVINPPKLSPKSRLQIYNTTMRLEQFLYLVTKVNKRILCALKRRLAGLLLSISIKIFRQRRILIVPQYRARAVVATRLVARNRAAKRGDYRLCGIRDFGS